jgi:hypothetical protein
MKRQLRLQSARSWLSAKGAVRAGEYARRYNVDKYTAYQELTMIGAPIDDHDHKYANRPPDVPKRRRRAEVDHEESPFTEHGIIEWGGHLIMPMGHTSGGVPFGIMGEELRQLLLEWGFEGDWLEEPWEAGSLPSRQHDDATDDTGDVELPF